jgi:acetolactate synthase-1/2/3 large subunit
MVLKNSSFLDGGRLVGKALKAEGVEYLFGLWGDHMTPAMMGCDEEGIKIIDVRHEQAAGHAAEGWARVTGQPGVAMVTAGPGVTNVFTALANAFYSGSPMLVLAGRSPIDSNEKSPLQEMDHLEFVRPVTKWARTVYEAKRIPEYISIAYRHALAGRPGPVLLELPMDVVHAPVEESEVIFPEPAKSRTGSSVLGNSELVKKAVELLIRAERPAVIAGNTVYWSQASTELAKFIETIQAPTYLNGMGRGCISPDHPLFFNYSRRFAFSQADVALLIGTAIDFRLNYGEPPFFNKDTKVIQIDIDQTEIGHNRLVDVGIMGDIKEVLKQLLIELEGIKAKDRSDWLEKVRAQERQREEAFEPFLNSDAVPIHPLRLLKEVRDFLRRDAIVVGDGGDIVSFAARVLKIHYPGHWLDPGRLGCLGVGAGFALAAKLARPDKQVLIIHGDGAFGFSAMEFDTMVRHKIPVVSVIGNNQGWSTVPEGSRPPGRCLGSARYDGVVKALGGYGELVEKPEQIRPALERAFASGLPSVLNVMIDQTVAYGHVTSPFTASM